VTVAPRRDWSIERRVDTVRRLHDPWPEPDPRVRRVALCRVVGARAVVLGSTQRVDVVDLERAARSGVDVVHRSSGGGAVTVGPGAQVWIDAWVPRDDPLWDDDVIGSSLWLGETWVRALEGLGADRLAVHEGRATRTEWSDVVCFAGLGPGEVTTATAKVVGVAQRRARHGARVHSMAALVWEPASLLALLSLGPDRAQVVRDHQTVLDDVATGIRDIVPRARRDSDAERVIASVEDAVLSALP
jgi:lipoate-protein ligase A